MFTPSENAPQQWEDVMATPASRPTLTQLMMAVGRELDAIDATLDAVELPKDKIARVDNVSLGDRTDELRSAMQTVISRLKELHSRLQAHKAQL